MEGNEQLHLARVRQVEQVHAASRSSARATLPPAGCWLACWVSRECDTPTPPVINLQPTYCKLHVLSAVPTCHARVSSKRSPEAGRKKHYCFVLFRFLTVAGPPGGFSSAIANTVRLVGVAVPRVQVQR
jgi:hypothetical protein